MQALRAAVLLLLCPVLGCGGQTIIGAGVIVNQGTIIGVSVAPTLTFSPPAGHYSTTQSVTIAGPAGTTCYYTTDGSTPNIASTLYTAPITVSADATLSAVCANVIKRYTNVQATSSGWKCVVASATTYPSSLTCQTGGGVIGTLSDASMTFGSSAVFSASTTQSSSENQILFVNTQVGAGGAATMLAEDEIIEPSQGSTYVANQEADVNLNDSTQSPPRYHALGWQCNQQSGTLQWQVDNQQGSWQTISPPITFGCPLSTTQATEIRTSMHWTNGDTGCGGYGCDQYDQATICVGGTCNTYSLGTTLEAYTETWGDIMIIQDQTDLTNTTQSGANPTTSTRTITQDNMAAGVYSTMVTATAGYTIP